MAMNPFPGMNPYLEDAAFWRDFHATFIVCLREAIMDVLPDAYEGRVDESVRLVQVHDETSRLIYPDVAISHEPWAASASHSLSGMATATLEPQANAQAIYEEVRETRVEILHRPERELVTVIELLSPANKNGDGYHQYSVKRTALLQEPVNILELDFLVQGKRLRLLKPLPQGDYFAYLTRAEKREACHVYAWSMRNRLPTLPVPLRVPDPDLHIDLQAVFDVTYQRGRYARSVNYKQDLTWLPPEAQTWVRERIQASA
jgi:hypothetical protein